MNTLGPSAYNTTTQQQMSSGVFALIFSISCTQRLLGFIYLHLFTDCFMKISHQSSEQIQRTKLSIDQSTKCVFQNIVENQSVYLR